MKRIAQWVALWLAIISVLVFMTILSTLITFPVYAHMDDLPQIAVMSLGRLYQNYLQLMAYLNLPWVGTLHMNDFPTSVHGAIHFADVRHLFLFDIGVAVVTVPFAVRWLHQLRIARKRYLLVRPFMIGAVVPVVLTAILAANFDQFFITFHEVLFRNSDWLFDPATDPIINVLPEGFFMLCFLTAFALFEAVMIWGIWRGRQDAKVA
ncbi:TIGR01906 family membrane protein [Lactobacillus paracasei subsp. paracasei]|uniref:TIGR01906 family membrane protein n=1 Tax=Lacticaseibacillus paracasei TaxID=1597 RepID=UPI0018C740FD|nr:TIGR01906 family membrane protein [Lacticaseibacillus paracasei]MBG1273368.1 TIGR01906 family membrane protein [Lacticaseibacillus paracasei subsp. paracasei]